jgi:hypothetical protein
MSIKIFTMVKDEVDIIEYWIKYHGTLFGYENLYIVDNMSTDGTYETIEFYKNHGVHLFKEEDYKQKGEIMTRLINSIDNYDIAFPIDIDEFIVYYNEDNNKINPKRSVKYLHNLIKIDYFHKNTIFKANYIQTLIDDDTEGYGYKNAIIEMKYGVYQDYKGQAKTFLNKKNWNGVLDHGNHYPSENYTKTNICLVHYHCRNIDQMRKKIENNVQGLGYPIDNLDYLKALPERCSGFHHVKHMICILENNFKIPICKGSIETGCICLQPIIDFVKELNIIP